MKKVIFKKTAVRKSIIRSMSRLPVKSVSESQFWKKIALEQQILLHAKNST